ncbi:RICIN domain-containing protein [Hymenobacter sp. HSC-4F20]|uniref:RICIN domain-containing protein n=1 Tax=Hymenobacter sp. HSC-4F20 TaxID=2864135 RepID=UPI001C72B82E|nr:RICIN domain-containing protein [Hymenobacter sp. HSC-4F20]MBX0288924.1 RICIN domain-containing protein [Hymenobacter sp. HSC-4F20]
MKKLYSCGMSAALLLAGLSAPAQTQPAGPAYPLGSTQTLVRQFEAQVAAGTARRQAPVVALRVSANQVLAGKVNYREDLLATGELVVGEIQGVPNSSFQVRIEGPRVEGNIILRDSRRAYRYSADAQGNASVQEVDINKVICIDYNKPVGYQSPAPNRGTTANRAAVLSLQSYPGARGCIMLDLDGQYVAGTGWNNGNPISAAPAQMVNDNAKVQALWELVSEDFRPFSLNVTTDEAVFNSYPKNMRMRCIITPTNTAAPGAGGVAYIQSFNWNDDTPCWVFMSDDPKTAGEAASHEVGHTLGLGHDGRLNPDEGYYTGQDNAGPWAPIMGAGYYKPVTHWSRGEYNRANNQQDDLSIMASATYNVGYRNDDHSNSTTGATALSRNGNSLSGSGIIERTSDQDYFAFTTAGGAVSLNVNTVGRYGNLDIVARLFTSTGTQIGTFDTGGGGNLNTTISANLSAGTYYVQIDGTSSGNPATDGYSDYGSLGTFSISGTAPAGATSAGVATLYKDCNYTGTATGLDPGDYTLGALQARGILNDDISSLKVNSGYEVQLFENDNFSGASVVITASNTCLVSNSWNDRTTSLRVRTSGVTSLSGVYTLQNRNSGLNLDVNSASTADGTALIQWTGNGCTCQQFQFTHLGGGVYQITAVHSGKSLDIRDVSTADGAVVQQWTYSGGANQQFIAQSTGDGYYKLIAKHSSKLLEVAGSSTAGSAAIQQWTDNNSATQQWRLTPATSAFSSLIQAESYSAMNGVITETTTDAGGGQNVGSLDAGDWLTYNSITIPSSGSYTIEYRVASLSGGGRLSSDLNAGATVLGMLDVPSTGGWQNWTTISHTVSLSAGTYNLGVFAQAGGWNLNWLRISKAAGAGVAQTAAIAASTTTLELYPNPVTDRLQVRAAHSLAGSHYRILDGVGRTVATGSGAAGSIDVSALTSGVYLLELTAADGKARTTGRFVK